MMPFVFQRCHGRRSWQGSTGSRCLECRWKNWQTCQNLCRREKSKRRCHVSFGVSCNHFQCKVMVYFTCLHYFLPRFHDLIELSLTCDLPSTVEPLLYDLPLLDDLRNTMFFFGLGKDLTMYFEPPSHLTTYFEPPLHDDLPCTRFLVGPLDVV